MRNRARAYTGRIHGLGKPKVALNSPINGCRIVPNWLDGR
jgi:hypothetical protein